MQIIASILDEDAWNFLFPVANSLYDYQSFLRAAAKFPAFCFEGTDDLCKRELATFFAHTTKECGTQSEDSYPEWR